MQHFHFSGYIFGKELTLDVGNAIVHPTPKSMIVDKEKASTAETPTAASSRVDINSEDPPTMGERVVENGSAYSQTEVYLARSPGSSALARVAMERSPAGSPAARTTMERSPVARPAARDAFETSPDGSPTARTAMERRPVASPAARDAFERSPDGSPAARAAFQRSPYGSPASRHAFDSPFGELLDSHFFKPFSEEASPHAKETQVLVFDVDNRSMN